MYSHHYTPQTISNMIKAISEQIEAFKSRILDKRYVCVYLVATYISLKRDTVSKEAVYIGGDIREEGSKEVLAYAMAPREFAFILLKNVHKNTPLRTKERKEAESFTSFLPVICVILKSTFLWPDIFDPQLCTGPFRCVWLSLHSTCPG